MNKATQLPRLIDRLPKVRGRLIEDAPLAPLSWFRAGGPAEVLFKPADIGDLTAFLTARPADIPVTVLGVGSNLLIRDGGVKGVVIRLGKAFADVTVQGDIIFAGAGALDTTVALAAAEAGLGGLEFLSGIPGTIGGGLRMNAGAYGREFRDVLLAATAIDGTGQHFEITGAEMGLSYRHCDAPEDWIFLHATLSATPADPAAIYASMAEIKAKREESQPIRTRTGGSTFANPPGAKAWELIDRAGCRGLTRGAAMVSDLHTNFLVNLGGATAADIEGLGEEVRRRVFEMSGIRLEWEIRRIGSPIPDLREAP
jgi:UDP-N-acetylmuramate dehydrogenase